MTIETDRKMDVTSSSTDASEKAELHTCGESAVDCYEKGNMYRRNGDFQRAMSCYNEAIERNPEYVAAKTARKMLLEQYAFFHKDYYNP